MPVTSNEQITLIGLGAIGLSFAALHLRYTEAVINVFDPRSDLEQYILSVFTGYINSNDPSLSLEELQRTGRFNLCSSLEEACLNATIVQEQGPENLDFKRSTWAKVESLVSSDTHLWSSTSGIAASLQNQDMSDKSRLLVVHPFNPPHIIPLIEIIPSPDTDPREVKFVESYFDMAQSGHRPVVIHKEIPGFVGNRLAFALLREACYLVDQGVVSASDLDVVVQASLGPRWAVQGPFNSYNMGGGQGGIESFLSNLSGTIQNVWDTSIPINFVQKSTDLVASDNKLSQGWEAKVIEQTQAAYGYPDPLQLAARDESLRRVLEIQKSTPQN